MIITFLEIAFDLTYVILKKSVTGIYHGGKYLLKSSPPIQEENKTEQNKVEQETIDLFLLESIKELQQSNNTLQAELESMKICIEELKKNQIT